MMQATTRRFVLRLVRLQNAFDLAELGASVAYEMDLQFDGGECSGPALQRALDRTKDRVAERFGFASADLALDVAGQLGAIVATPYHVMLGGALPLPR